MMRHDWDAGRRHRRRERRLRVGGSSDTPGIDVRLCNRSGARLQEIRQSGGITVTGAVSGVASISLLTTEVAEAVHSVDVVAVTVPTPALPYYAGPLAETTTDEQLIWLNPGHSGGALYLGTEIRRRRGGHPLVCQLSTASHGSRMAGPATVGGLCAHRGVAGSVSEP